MTKSLLIKLNIPPQPRYITNLFPDWQPTSLLAGVRRTVEFYRHELLMTKSLPIKLNRPAHAI